jgi:hypothetical protein
LTGGDKSKATLTGTIASDGGTTHSNMPVKAQVRKTLGDAAYNNSTLVTFSGSTTTIGLAPGMPLTGTGIPASTTISAVASSTTLTLSAATTGGSRTGQSLVFEDLTRITHINGSDTLNNADTMMTIATGTGGDPVLFNARRYIGSGVARSITGFGFQPDLVWIKGRSAGGSHAVYDSVRGAFKRLETDGVGAEATQAACLSSFDADGFSIGTDGSNNGSGVSTVAWGWKAGGAPSGELVGTGATMSGTSGAGTIHNNATGVVGATSITQSVSQTSGLSITNFYGAAGGSTFPHNLGGTPAMFIMKVSAGNAGQNWMVWHQNLSATTTKYLQLEGNAAEGTDANGFTPAPSSTVISSGSANPFGGHPFTFICYAWKAVAGVSAFGVYTGNGGANAITYANSNSFTARFIIIKCLNNSGSWHMHDTFRGMSERLYANTAAVAADDTGTQNYYPTPTSTGFSYPATVTDGGWNANTYTYIYAAFA